MSQKHIAAFQALQARIQVDSALCEQILRSQSQSRLYLDAYSAPVRKIKGESRAYVIETDTFQAAKAYVDGKTKVAVLNFANPHEPGGGVWRGASAQEESLCRASILYNVLDQPYFHRHFYRYHYENCGWSNSDRVLYTPDITVLQTAAGESADFQVDVITCAAPFLDDWSSAEPDELKAMYRARLRNILEVAIGQDVDVLILGAFGCGAFRNDPYDMAAAFAQLLLREEYARFFHKVIFAIKRSGYHCINLSAFSDAFGG